MVLLLLPQPQPPPRRQQCSLNRNAFLPFLWLDPTWFVLLVRFKSSQSCCERFFASRSIDIFFTPSLHSSRFDLLACRVLRNKTELEVGLRLHCQRQRVIEKLNGAHIVIPGQGETTLALRAYYPMDLMQQQHQQQQEKSSSNNPNLPTTVPHHQVLQHIHQESQHDDLFDRSDNSELIGLRLFQRSFAVTIVFFVLPQNSPERQHQFDDIGSFMHRATSLLMDHQPSTANGSNNNNIKHGHDNKKSTTSIRMTRVFVVQDTAQAIETIMVLADALSREKRLLKRAFFKRQRVANFMPLSNTNTDPHPPSQGQEHRQQLQQQLDAVAMSQAAGAFRQWASDFQLPPGEADVLMKFFGSTSLQAILTATEEQLVPVPIEDRTRTLLHMFFEGSSSSSPMVGHRSGTSNSTVAAASQDHQRYYHPTAPLNHWHDFTMGTYDPSVGHEAVWNGTAPNATYGVEGASYNNPSFLPGPHTISSTNHTNGNHLAPYGDGAAAYGASNPQSSSFMTIMPGAHIMRGAAGQQSLLVATGGPPSTAMTAPTMTSAFFQQRQQQQLGPPPIYLQQEQQQQHGPPPMTQGRPNYLQREGGGGGGGGGGSSMHYGNNASQFAGGGGGGDLLLSQREQMRRWM
jgi:hypothetical protein